MRGVSAVGVGGMVFKGTAFRVGVGFAWVRDRNNGPVALILPQTIV
jgi:hypothetical protein